MTLLRSVLLAVLLPLPWASAQTITIDSVPPYATPGSISGTVTGVNFATHRVAVYIYIDGAGWFTKPSTATPSVPIQPNGTFTANVYQCCLDDEATIYCAALIAPGVTPPLAASSCRVPANLQSLAIDHVERYGRTIEFAGRTWAVKDSTTPVGPGFNYFSDSTNSVWVDAQGQLHLRVTRNGLGPWLCSEVVLLDDVGYGTYWFTTETQVGSLDPNLTFGAFTWDAYCDDTTIPAWPNREIDFEDSRWGNPGDPNSSQVVVQPFQVPGNATRYNTPFLSPTPTLSRYFTWQPNRIDFGAVAGVETPCSPPTASIVHVSSYVPGGGRVIPPAGRQKFRFNLWINGGGAPSNGQSAEIIISDFRYAPSAGTFLGGCDINPEGSASLLSGVPAIGTTFTLGVDNPVGTQPVGSSAVLLVGAEPTAGFPCGLSLPGFGMAGPVGEFQLNAALPLVAVPGSTSWAGPGNPVPFPITIPFVFALLGQSIYAQGIMVDAGGAVPLGLTDAIELCVRI